MSVKDPLVTDLSPDGFSRFFILADILRDVYGDSSRTLRILDVGGGSEFMQQQLDMAGIVYDLTVLDIIERPKKVRATYIQGDATAMSFPDGAFDVVLSTDVLEHVLPERKRAFLDECLRVAKELCIIAAPFDTPGVNAAEVTVNNFNKQLFGVGQSWLEEHLKYGKPTREMFLSKLEKEKIPFCDFGTQNLTTWLLNTHLNLIEAKLGLGAKKHIVVNRFYNQNILQMNEFAGPTYRHFFVMFPDPNMEHNFNVQKYTKSITDYSKTAKYINMLMDLTTTRISELRKENQKSETLALNFREELKKSEIREAQLRATVEEQKHTLDKLEPVLRLARTPLAKKACSLLRSPEGKTHEQ